MELTPKQRRFVEEYQVDLNGTQAAIRAGYSPKTAEVQGSRLLSNAKVALAVQAAQIEVSKRIVVTVDDVVAGLLAEAEGKDDSTPSSRVAAWSHLGKHLGMDHKDILLKIERTPAEDMTDAEIEAELEADRREHMALMTPAEAKAEMQRVHGELAELTAIADGGS